MSRINQSSNEGSGDTNTPIETAAETILVSTTRNNDVEGFQISQLAVFMEAVPNRVDGPSQGNRTPQGSLSPLLGRLAQAEHQELITPALPGHSWLLRPVSSHVPHDFGFGYNQNRRQSELSIMSDLFREISTSPLPSTSHGILRENSSNGLHDINNSFGSIGRRQTWTSNTPMQPNTLTQDTTHKLSDSPTAGPSASRPHLSENELENIIFNNRNNSLNTSLASDALVQPDRVYCGNKSDLADTERFVRDKNSANVNSTVEGLGKTITNWSMKDENSEPILRPEDLRLRCISRQFGCMAEMQGCSRFWVLDRGSESEIRESHSETNETDELAFSEPSAISVIEHVRADIHNLPSARRNAIVPIIEPSTDEDSD